MPRNPYQQISHDLLVMLGNIEAELAQRANNGEAITYDHYLAFASHVAALLLATIAIVCFVYSLKPRKFLAQATAVTYAAHLGFLVLS